MSTYSKGLIKNKKDDLFWLDEYRIQLLIILCLLFCLLPTDLKAQNDPDIRVIGPQRSANKHFIEEPTYGFRTGIDVLPSIDTRSFRYWLVNGVQLNPRFFTGVGVGFTYYNDPLSLIPLFIDLNYSFKRDGLYPFIFLKSGYNFSVHTDTDYSMTSHSGGPLFNPGMGVQYDTAKNISWQVSIGYNSDQASYREEGFGIQTIETDVNYRRLMFGLAVIF